MEITQIKETCLYVHDLTASKKFYHGKLGFEVIAEEDRNHIFFRAGKSVLLCFNPEMSKVKKSPPPHFAFGKQHIAFEVLPEQYQECKSKIRSLGIEIIQEQEWKNNLESFYFLDPD